MDTNQKIMEWVLWLEASDKEQMLSGASTEHPVWSHVEKRIERAFKFGGMVRLHVGRPSRSGNLEFEYFQFLGMDSFPGKFRLIFSPEMKSLNEKLDRLIWWESGDTPYRGTELFGDDEWDARTICSDLTIAKQIFKDLFEHGGLTECSFNQMRSAWNPKPR
jgi:hypothetical protein